VDEPNQYRTAEMTENAGLSPEDAASARAAEQARLRKERREAKIKAGGSARLNKITGLGGGLQRGQCLDMAGALYQHMH
jgi:RecA/RadA recombinase